MSDSRRYLYLDTLRGTLMTLGVLVHAAQIYNTTPSRTHIGTDHGHWIFDYLLAFSYSFRMPAFFLVAGFFAALLLSRRSPGAFLRNRLLRLGIPLLVCGLLLNSWVYYLSRGTPGYPSEFNMDYWLGGGWLFHLWFLANLIYYALIALLLSVLFPRLPSWCAAVRAPWIVQILFVAFAGFVLVRLGWRLPEPAYGDRWFLMSMTNFWRYLPLFMLGYLLYHNRTAFETLVNARGKNLLVVVIGIAGFFATQKTMPSPWAAELLANAYALAFSGLLVYLFKRFLNTDYWLTRRWADAAYTIYLLHFPVTISLAYLLMPTGLPATVQFSVIVTITALLCYWFHWLVVDRISAVSIALNGKMPHRLPTTSQSI